MQRKSRSDIRCEIADEAIKEEGYDWHRSVDLAIKRYATWRKQHRNLRG